MKNLYFIIISFTINIIFLNNLSYANINEDDEFFEEFDFVSNKSEIYDPFEKINRKIFAFNNQANKYILTPTTKSYRFIIPKFARKSIKNFLTNLSLPFSILNSVIQGDLDNSLSNISSFLINSTIGIGGIFDVAGNKNIKYVKQDFGNTLQKYGIGNGPYLVIPLIGPSTIRNASGTIFENAIDPFSFNVTKVSGEKNLISDRLSYSLIIMKSINKYNNVIDILNDLENDSFDFYASVRSSYIQHDKLQK